MTPVAVYRMYDELGSLVYVGQTQDPKVRFASHRIRAPWWPLVRGVDVEWHPDRAAALEVERLRAVVEQVRELADDLDREGYPVAHLILALLPEATS